MDLQPGKAVQDVYSPSLAANIEVRPDEILDNELKPADVDADVDADADTTPQEPTAVDVGESSEDELKLLPEIEAETGRVEAVKGGRMADELPSEVQEKQVGEQSRKEKAATSFPSWLE